MSTPKKKAAKKAAKENPVLMACTVIENGTRIGSMICARGAKAQLPPDKAKALEDLKKVRIDGVI